MGFAERGTTAKVGNKCGQNDSGIHSFCNQIPLSELLSTEGKRSWKVVGRAQTCGVGLRSRVSA